VAPSDVASLDELVELSHSVEDKEGWIIEFSNGLFIKIKTSWYVSLHGLLTDDLYREHLLVRYVLDEKIDDVLGQVPEEEVEAHARIEKIIAVVKHAVSEKVKDINKSYELFIEGDVKDLTGDLRLQLMRKTFALKYRKERNFGYVMSLSKGNVDVYDLAKGWVSDQTKKMKIAREFLLERDSSLFFIDVAEDENED
jgi:hypothetical protein